MISEHDDICENIATFTTTICDKCKGNGLVRYMETISNDNIWFIYRFFHINFYHRCWVIPAYQLARNVLYKMVICDKCNGKRNISILNKLI